MDLHNSTLAHVEFGEKVAICNAAESRPAVEGECMFFAVEPFGLEQNFLMMTVTCGVWDTVNISQMLRDGKNRLLRRVEDITRWAVTHPCTQEWQMLCAE